MKFTMQTDKVVATKSGHAIEFKKGEPTHVPKECWREVQAAGAVPEDQEKVNAVAPPKPAAPDDPDEREKQIFAAFDMMVEANKREDFTGAGTPKTDSLSKLVGFDVDAKERDALWIKFTQEGRAQ